MMKKVKPLITKKRSLKTELNLFETFLSNFQIVEDDTKEQKLTDLERRLQKIDPLLDSFIEVDNELNYLQEVDSDPEELSAFQDKYFEITSKASTLLDKYRPKDINTQYSDRSNYANEINQWQNRGTKVALPTINLPTFDGTFTQWREYKDKFTSLIASDTQLTNTQKLSYLKASLTGEPSDLLGSLETTDNNYEIAWNRLEKRYNNKRRIINNHVQAILNIQSLTRESYLGLKTIINLAQNHIDCLKTFDVAVEQWDALLVPILSSKLDIQTSKEWEAKLNRDVNNTDKIPSVNEFLEFLNVKQNTLEAMYNRTKSEHTKPVTMLRTREVKSFTTTISSCVYCKNEHSILNCNAFSKLDETSRNQKIRELKVCINCLRKGHFVSECKSSFSCKLCKRRHHSLLHMNHKQSDHPQLVNNSKSEQATTSVVTSNCSTQCYSTNQVFLSTAKVHVIQDKKEPQEIRVLLDSASQANFLTQHMCEKLNLKPKKVNLVVKGINNANSSITEQVQLTIKSKYNNYETTLNCFVLPTISNNLPIQTVSIENFSIPLNIKLADPTFSKSGPIDLLLGAGVFYDLLCIGQIKQKDSPTLQKTKLGWVVSGSYSQANVNDTQEVNSYLTLEDLHKSVEKFWNQEEPHPKEIPLTQEEQYCENYFQATTTRDPSGRFIVRIPFKTNKNQLGDSEQTAVKRFLSLEKHLNNNSIKKQTYTAFINEYYSLNHMTKVEQATEKGFYLPHHAVENLHSTTTKLRVVFDGSCKLDNGLSINEIQCTGPTIQDDLISIIARFRTYQFVITADIEKMYRQVLIHPEDRKYQKIFWRTQPNQELSTYELNTVTYGTTAAPFLAVRALTELAKYHEKQYSRESKIISKDFYVDDLLTGSNSIEELKLIKSNLTYILNSGGFNLYKWTSNVNELGTSTPNNEPTSISITEKVHKTLGVYWNPNSDVFSYVVNQTKPVNQITKRTILATTAQLFDPLGLLAPTVIFAKLIIQDIWKLKIGWDETVPMDIFTRWISFKDKLKFINNIKIKRHAIIPDHHHIEIHAFSDASEKGYGSCVYLKSVNGNNEVQISLFTAKSKVAPIKLVTLPRLELCAAVISAHLVNKVKSMLNFSIDREYYWSDSQITLCWIKSQANKYNTYVANRITEIQSVSNPDDWYYIKSQENPADLLSRGILPDKLLNVTLWWQGPSWLKESSGYYLNDTTDIDISELPEKRKSANISSFIIIKSTKLFTIENYSSLNKLHNIVAYCLRFRDNLLAKGVNRRTGPITVEEIKNARSVLIQQVQRECFQDELLKLHAKTKLDSKTKLMSLSPFLDQDGIIRVGGRLEHSDFTYDKKHPMILPSNHHLTTLIFRHYHQILLHAGPKLLLSSVREQFWPLNGRNAAKKIVRECVRCIRYQAKSVSQIMGNLPRNRTIIMPPFHITGIDYGGPFYIKDRQGRGNKVTKAYICLFICFSTKCIHLELVSDLSTQAFMATLRRFIGRRGKPAQIYSDNGTNFVGANKEITMLYNFINQCDTEIKIQTTQLGIQWHFIPPYAPNFGGLWEAGIKSTKFHIKRAIGDIHLTYEDFNTVLIQIESILNSRPLSPLTSDPNDMEALTPAHFLIGRQFTTIPDPNVRDIKCSRLHRYQHLQQMNQHFWDQWSKSYIGELQQRSKWATNTAKLKIGTMVILKEDTTPPSRWHLGRITAVHPGTDNVVRVVSVKCNTGEVKRAISKICVLPIKESD